jgi:hypothetical protein
MIKPLQTLHWKFHGVPKRHNCYELERVQRILRKVYHSTIIFASLNNCDCSSWRTTQSDVRSCHPLNGGCSETVSCIHHTAWGILGVICNKSTELVSFDGFICAPKIFIIRCFGRQSIFTTVIEKRSWSWISFRNEQLQSSKGTVRIILSIHSFIETSFTRVKTTLPVFLLYFMW